MGGKDDIASGREDDIASGREDDVASGREDDIASVREDDIASVREDDIASGRERRHNQFSDMRFFYTRMYVPTYLHVYTIHMYMFTKTVHWYSL